MGSLPSRQRRRYSGGGQRYAVHAITVIADNRPRPQHRLRHAGKPILIAMAARFASAMKRSTTLLAAMVAVHRRQANKPLSGSHPASRGRGPGILTARRFGIAPKYDPELHSTREGVLIHQSGHGESSSDITSSGCFAVAHSQWDRAKAAIQQKLAPYGGRGTLRVGPDGNAEVLPRLNRKRTSQWPTTRFMTA